MYEVGGYKYKSIEHYRKLLIKVWFIFASCFFILLALKGFMELWLFFATLLVDLSMVVHLPLRYLHSKKVLKYVFNEY